MTVGTVIGTHDTGLWDRANNIKTTKVLGQNVNAAEAVKLTQENKGAELLIEKQNADGTKTYDVYQLKVEGKEGKSLKSVDLFENIDFEENLAKEFGGTQAIFAQENEYWGPDAKKDFISYWNVREDLGRSWKGFKYAITTGATNVMSFISGGKGVGPSTMGQYYMNERLVYEAEKVAKAQKTE